MEFADATWPRLGQIALLSKLGAGGMGVDGRSDVYGLGATAFYARAGWPPFDANRGGTVIAAVLSAETPHLRDHVADLPPALSDLVRRMMSRDPSDRFPDMDQVLASLPPEPGGE